MKTPFFDSKGRLIAGATVLTDFKSKDPTCADVAVPRAFREIEAKGGRDAQSIAKEAGFSVKEIKSAWSFCLAFLLLFAMGARAGDLTGGYFFVDGVKLFASQLNQQMSAGVINPSFYTGKTIESTLNADDTILVVTAGGLYRKISANAFILDNTDWFTNKLVELSVPDTNTFFLVYDGTGLQLKKTSLGDIVLSPVLLGQLATNWQNILYLGPTNATYPTNIISLKTNLVNGNDRFWLYDSVTTSNVAVTFSNVQSSLLYAMPLSFGVGLTITNGATSNLLGVAATEIPLRGTNGQGLLARNVSLSLNVAANGTNGFYPTNLLPAVGWVYSYVISDGTNIVGVLSTNYSTPSFPTNYYYSSRCLSASYYTNTALSAINQRGNSAWIQPVNMPDTISAVTVYTNFNTAWRTNFQATVPPIAASFSGSMLAYGLTNFPGGTYFAGIQIAYDTNGIGEQTISASGSTNGNGNKTIRGNYSVPVNWTTGPYYKSGITGMTNTVYISGYSLQ